MKRFIILAGSLFMVAGCTTTPSPDVISQINKEISAQPAAAGAGPFLSDPSEERWADGYILVQPRAGLSNDKFDSIVKGKGGRSIGRIRGLSIHKIEVPPQAEEAVARALSRNPSIKFAERDMLVQASEIIPNDPRYADAWHLPVIQASLAWDDSQGDGVTVAILDSGVYGSHPDLNSRMVDGWNVISNNMDTADINGHGTAVAGLAAAASNNAIGIASVGWNANIMPIRITNSADGYAYWSDVAAGLVWASDNGADVANISYNVSNSSTVSNAAQYMRNQGGIVVVAAGNDNLDSGYSDNPYMITVAATNKSDVKASFSNYGDFIDVAAPGDYMLTTNRAGGYSQWRGTSFASPTTAGVVALIMAANPNLTPDQVEEVLENSADDLVSGSEWHIYYGHGRINAAAAVQLALQTTSVDAQVPVATIFSPQNNVTVSGDLLVEVNATDDTGVSGVDLYADGELVGRDINAPYQFSWDSTQIADGNVTFMAYAQDGAGNEGSSNSVSVSVDNQPDVQDNTAPTVSIIGPADGSNVSRTVKIGVTSNDDVAVKKLSVLIDGVQMCSITDASSLSCSWNARKASDGSHIIKAIAEDGVGNSAETFVTVTTGSSSTSTTGRGKK